MELTTSTEKRAHSLLERMRETPMRRGALSKRASQLRREISQAIVRESVAGGLAQRVAFQLVSKFHGRELDDHNVWHAIGRILRQEVVRLKEEVGLADRKIVTILPKLSAAQIEEFLQELTRADRRIARTILNAAIDAAEPLVTGRRYLAEYRIVVRRLQAIDPTMARTMANATFAAGVPLSKAMEHLERFSTLMAKHQDHPDVARLLARAGFRAR